MKKHYLLSMFILASAACMAQTVSDSIQTGAAYANDVYYSLNNGKVKTVANNDWQIALSIGTFNVGVRANTTTGSSGDGSVTIYEKPGKDTTQWANFDSSGYKAWSAPDNSDVDWEEGAFNRNIGGAFDYGWGEYDPSSHLVVGNRLYIAVIKSGSSTVYKKLWILNKTFGDWNIRYANLDGTSEQNLLIKSSDYATKNFAYVNMLTDQVLDREPSNDSWDFVLTRYKAFQPGPDVYYASTGILTNKGVLTAEARGINKSTATLPQHIMDTSDDISAIGADWKKLNASFQYDMVDSLLYFVKAVDGAYWKLEFTAFAGSSTGNTVFNKTRITGATGIAAIGNDTRNMVVYPNPANDVLNISVRTANNATAVITDLAGKAVLTQQLGASFDHQMDVSGLPEGFYLLHFYSGTERTVQKIVIR